MYIVRSHVVPVRPARIDVKKHAGRDDPPVLIFQDMEVAKFLLRLKIRLIVYIKVSVHIPVPDTFLLHPLDTSFI
jgi:hypothetical protein